MLIKKIDSIIKTAKLFSKNDRILVAVSGGPDSVCLLYVLKQLQHSYGFELFVAHLNHKLRSRASIQDELFVRALAKRLGLRGFFKRADTVNFSRKNRLSLEDAGRKLRYEFFEQICRKNRIPKIALAHTRNDQAETVLMRFLRGAGVQGLSGIRAKSSFSRQELIRPLLTIDKKEILEFLTRENIKYRIDKSNLETDFLRNKLRLKLIPCLRKYNPQIDANLVRMAENFAEVFDFLNEEIEHVCRKIARISRRKIILERKAYSGLHPALRKEIIRWAIRRLCGDFAGFELRHCVLIDVMACSDSLVSKMDLPKDMEAEVLKNSLVLKMRGAASRARKVIKKKMNPEDRVLFPELGIEFESRFVDKKKGYKKHSHSFEYFNADKLEFPLTLRIRKNGDVFYPLGAAGRKKLKKFFNDEKIALQHRDEIILVCSGNDIIWVSGIRLSEKYKVDADTKKVLRIDIKKTARKKTAI